MGAWDVSIVTWLNAFARHWPAVDRLAVLVASNDLLKGGTAAVVLWAFWSVDRAPLTARHARPRVLATLLGVGVALIMARAMALLLPFRGRPLHTLPLLLPDGLWRGTLDGWSSFPSDHATLFFGLATGLALISRRVGWLAFLYGAVFIALPRLYLGLHYPTDLVIGAVLGVGVVRIAHAERIRCLLARRVLVWADDNPALFHGTLFLVTFQIATLFNAVREGAHDAHEVLRVLPRPAWLTRATVADLGVPLALALLGGLLYVLARMAAQRAARGTGSSRVRGRATGVEIEDR